MNTRLLQMLKKDLSNKYNPNLLLETYNCDIWFEYQESTDATRKSDKEESVDLFDMPPLQGDEEV